METVREAAASAGYPTAQPPGGPEREVMAEWSITEESS